MLTKYFVNSSQILLYAFFWSHKKCTSEWATTIWAALSERENIGEGGRREKGKGAPNGRRTRWRKAGQLHMANVFSALTHAWTTDAPLLHPFSSACTF